MARNGVWVCDDCGAVLTMTLSFGGPFVCDAVRDCAACGGPAEWRGDNCRA